MSATWASTPYSFYCAAHGIEYAYPTSELRDIRKREHRQWCNPLPTVKRPPAKSRKRW